MSNPHETATSAITRTELKRPSRRLDEPISLTVDHLGNVYVGSKAGFNVFQIAPDGTITEITIRPGFDFNGLAVDSANNVYASTPSRVYRITFGTWQRQGIVDFTYNVDGVGLSTAAGVAVDGRDNVYVTGEYSNNVLRITPGGTISQVLDFTGDGLGNILWRPRGIAADATGNVYVVGRESRNVFEIEFYDYYTAVKPFPAGQLQVKPWRRDRADVKLRPSPPIKSMTRVPGSTRSGNIRVGISSLASMSRAQFLSFAESICVVVALVNSQTL